MEGYEQFKTKIFKLTGLDLSLYKEKQMRRRLESLIARYNKPSYDAFFELIKADKQVHDDFMEYLTINVSEFYRNPEQWEKLDKIIIPKLLKQNPNIKIWSAACSTGEEPYSLVLLLTNHLPLEKIKILACDIDTEAIRKAKEGVYSEKSLANIPKDLRNSYFEGSGRYYKISEKIKNRVEFKKMNLLADKYPSNIDLIVCRNVMIYFTEEAKNDMYHKFSDALVNNGILFVGSTEQIISPIKYSFMSEHTFFYQKTKA